MKQIQWFPGHMAKAINEINELVNSVDIVIEIIDARAPFSSSNPLIKELENKKPLIKVMSKTDLANPLITKDFIEYYKNNNILCLGSDIHQLEFKELKKLCLERLKEKIEKNKSRGIRLTAIKALIVGIPNVGKSTLINRLAKRASCKVENKPGVTKSRQYINVDNEFILLDTPGILWPSFDDEITGINLALIGSIKQDILPIEKLTDHLINLLTNSYKGLLKDRYDIDEFETNSSLDCYKILEMIAKSRGFIISQDKLDINRAMIHLLNEFKNGKLGHISLERVHG